MSAGGIVEPHRLHHRTQIALHTDVLLQHRLNRLRPQLERGDITNHEVEAFDAVGVAGGGHQRFGLIDRRGRILLVANPLEQLIGRRGELRERVHEAANSHRRHILGDIHQNMPIERQMERASHAWIVKRFLLVVGPGPLDHTLIERGCGHAGCGLGLARGHRINDACVVHAVRQDCRAELRREWKQIVELDTVEIRQSFVPVILVLLHHPDFVLHPSDGLVRASAGDV